MKMLIYILSSYVKNINLREISLYKYLKHQSVHHLLHKESIWLIRFNLLTIVVKSYNELVMRFFLVGA